MASCAEPTDVCALAYATLDCDQDYTTVMQLGCDDEAVVWVNGTQVAELTRQSQLESEPSFRSQIDAEKGNQPRLAAVGQRRRRLEIQPGLRHPGSRVRVSLRRRAGQRSMPKPIATLPPAIPATRSHGREIFADLKGVGCIKCHAVGGVGAKIGPDLAGIGTRYPRAELIRSVLEPSNRVAAGYQVTTIVTDAGKIYSGIIKTDAQDVVELVDVEGRVISIATGEIEERNSSSLSLMPSGLKDGLTPEAFADVIAYLESLK